MARSVSPWSGRLPGGASTSKLDNSKNRHVLPALVDLVKDSVASKVKSMLTYAFGQFSSIPRPRINTQRRNLPQNSAALGARSDRLILLDHGGLD